MQGPNSAVSLSKQNAPHFGQPATQIYSISCHVVLYREFMMNSRKLLFVIFKQNRTLHVRSHFTMNCWSRKYHLV